MSKLNYQQLISKYRKTAKSNRLIEAIQLLNELVRREPLNLEWIKRRAECHIRLEQYPEALVDYAKVVEKEPENEDFLINFGAALIRCNQYDHAREILLYVTELNPKNIGSYINLSQVYDQLGLPEEQLRVAMKAVQISPVNAMAYNNLGSVFSLLDMKNEAREAFLTAIALDGNLIMAQFNIALIDFDMGLNQKAIEAFEVLLNSNKPTKNEKDFIRFTASFAYFKAGLLEKGWLNYEYGFGLKISHKSPRGNGNFLKPKWDGMDLGGGGLFILREQGVTDEILFSNCFAELECIDGNVTIQCDARLFSIFQRTYPKIKFVPDTQEILTNAFLSKFKYFSAIGSVPGIFRKKIEDFNRPTKLLEPLPKLFDDFKNRMHHCKNKKLIGICWRSGLLSVGRNTDATVLTDWGLLLREKNYQFVNLMWSECEEEMQEAENKFGIKILRWQDIDMKNDFESVLAIIKNLDAVVTISSSPYVLSSFAGVKTMLLTPDLWPLMGQKKSHPWSKFITPFVQESNEHILKKLDLVIEELDSLFKSS